VSEAILDHPLITERYFFPRPARVPDVVTVPAADGSELACARFPGPEDGPMVVHFHGNGEVVTDHLPMARVFAAMGCGLFLAEYRGYGGSTGRPQLAAMLEDVEAVLDAAGSPPERTVVFGRSIGSIYALECVRRRPELAGLILESGIADVHERIRLRVAPAELGCTEEELLAQCGQLFDHRAKIGSYPGHVLVLHARGDHLVDVSHGERNHAWAEGAASAELAVLPHGDHNSVLMLNQEEYWAAVGRLVERLG
jgi:pimeloyl-ACP methyl ester carboxylesterase